MDTSSTAEALRKDSFLPFLVKKHDQTFFFTRSYQFDWRTHRLQRWARFSGGWFPLGTYGGSQTWRPSFCVSTSQLEDKGIIEVPLPTSSLKEHSQPAIQKVFFISARSWHVGLTKGLIFALWNIPNGRLVLISIFGTLDWCCGRVTFWFKN